MRIDTSLNEMENFGKRVSKYVRFFNKGDKIQMFLLLLVFFLTASLVVGYNLDDKKQ